MADKIAGSNFKHHVVCDGPKGEGRIARVTRDWSAMCHNTLIQNTEYDLKNWRAGRVAEGAPLLREYGVYSLIEGSNPSLSAIFFGMGRFPHSKEY